MAVTNFHYITRMSSGFKVYILEGQPNLRTEDRYRHVTNEKARISPVYPMKRKHSPERRLTADERSAKPRRPPLALTSREQMFRNLACSIQRLSSLSPTQRPASPPTPSSVVTTTTWSPSHRPAHRSLSSTPSPAHLSLSPTPSPTHRHLSSTPSPTHRHTSPAPSPTQRHISPAPSPTQRHLSSTPSPTHRHLNSTPSPTHRHLSPALGSMYGSPPMEEPLALIKKPRRDQEAPDPNTRTCSQIQVRPSVITRVSSMTYPTTLPPPLQRSHSASAAMSSAAYDPVVEEHFRRSLGVDYHRKAESCRLSVSVSVDDHFAKALGEKWFQLKASSPRSSSSSPATSNDQPSTTSFVFSPKNSQNPDVDPVGHASRPASPRSEELPAATGK